MPPSASIPVGPSVVVVRHKGARFWITSLVVAGWLLHPILTPAHVEGFSASIVSLALHINAGQIGAYDRLHPANLEYFALSRLGIVWWMSMLTGALGISGESAMRATTWLGFIALSTSSFVLTRRWANASNLATVLALLVIPGLAESSFFYNDTIFSAAIAVTALAVIQRFPGTVGAAVSGLLFGAAIVARLDAMLLAPAVFLIGYEQHGPKRALWSRALVFTVAALVPVLLIPAAFRTSILDVVSVTRHAVVLWSAFRPVQHAREVAFFLGIPAAMLAALGCLRLVRLRADTRLLLLVAVPAFFNAVAFGKILQARQLLPLTPFLSTLLILGWEHLSSASFGREGRLLRRTVLVVCCLVWVAPISVVRVSDGPRAPYGRLWSPLLWTRWQRAALTDQAEIRALVHKPRADSTIFLTDTWDADRYVHLALQETGYHVAFQAGVDACSRTAETFAKGQLRVLHIRLHQPFLPNWRALAALRLDKWAIPCVRSWNADRVIRLAPLEQLEWSIADSVRGALAAARLRALEEINEARYSPQIAIDVRASDLPSIANAYLRQAGRFDSLFYGEIQPTMSLEAAERLMAARAWQPTMGTP